MNGERKTQAEIMAERRDAWKAAREMLRNSDMHYTVHNVMELALFLMDGADDDWRSDDDS